MSHFQIFLPDVRGQKPELLEAVGLADFFDAAVWQPSPGPDGKHGMLLAWPSPGDQRHVYNAEQQTWRPALPIDGLAAGRYWIGFWNDAAPTPKQLQRRYPYRGRWMKLGDGQQWLCPEAAELPTDMIRADDGSWKYEVQRQFAAFCHDCDRWLVRLELRDEDPILLDDVATFVEGALRLNYRLTPEVANHLRLFTRDNVCGPLLAVVGLTTAHESLGGE